MTDNTMPDMAHLKSHSEGFNYGEWSRGFCNLSTTSYTRTDIHDATKAELERVKQSHAELLEAVLEYLNTNPVSAKLNQAIANAESVLSKTINQEKVVGND